MKAILFSEYGPPEVLKPGEVPRPAPADGEVLVKVHAASVNSWDWELVQGTPFVNRLDYGLRKPKRIKTLGADIAGRVDAAGSAVTRFQPGDAVFGDLSGCGWGGFAEYVCAPEKALTAKPAGLSFEQAAAVPQAAVMALQGLRDIGRVQPGQRVLINGAGGGVGTFAVQMAKAFGAEVTGVDSTEKLDTMRALGADHVIDYTQEDYTGRGEAYDLILDMVVNRPVSHYIRTLKPGGMLVLVGGTLGKVVQLLLLSPWLSMTGRGKLKILPLRQNRNMAAIVELLESGKVAPLIDRRYPLDAVPEALRYLGEGHAGGKVVITL